MLLILAALMLPASAVGRVCQQQGVDYVVETWTSGTSWVRRYKSGWLEQGGLVPPTVRPTGMQVIAQNFHRPFRDTNYSLTAIITSNNTLRFDEHIFAVSTVRQTNSFSWIFHSNNITPADSRTVGLSWRAAGFGVN